MYWAPQGPSIPADTAKPLGTTSHLLSVVVNGAVNAPKPQIPPALADEFDLDADDLHAAAANIRAGIACLAAL